MPDAANGYMFADAYSDSAARFSRQSRGAIQCNRQYHNAPKNSKDFREAEMPRKSLFIGLFACPGSYAHVSAALMSFL